MGNPYGELSQIADGMKRQALELGGRLVRHRLYDDLRLALYIDKRDEWHLMIWRPTDPPSPTEVVVLRGAFGVPHDCKSERIDPRHVKMVWRERRADTNGSAGTSPLSRAA